MSTLIDTRNAFRLLRDADEEVATRSDIEELTGQEVKGPLWKVDDEPEPESA